MESTERRLRLQKLAAIDEEIENCNQFLKERQLCQTALFGPSHNFTAWEKVVEFQAAKIDELKSDIESINTALKSLQEDLSHKKTMNLTKDPEWNSAVRKRGETISQIQAAFKSLDTVINAIKKTKTTAETETTKIKAFSPSQASSN